MTLHTLSPAPHTLHGTFARDRSPVLVVNPGDTVRFADTLDVSWGMEPPTDEVSPRAKWEPREDGPALHGPVAIRGARPGQTLAVHIEAVRPCAWGWTYAGGPSMFSDDLNQALGLGEETIQLRWALDRDAMTGTNQHGHVVKLRPFLGMLGMPGPEDGPQSAWSPRATGGNMDCKELVAGSVLFLPIAVEGGLVSVGDGHAVQGDGEVSGMAIETRMDHVDLRFELLDDMPIATPHVRTATGWATLGFGEDLDAAIATALNAMVDLIAREERMPRAQALGLASLVVDLRITQLVNGVRGVHAFWPHGSIGRAT
ncbi:MAG: acetamidase [Cyanobacteria bacterium RYN_339]|nr:acetamidase [Cyanobacteria bacterium RYN_339]